MPTDTCFMSASELAVRIREQELSPVTVIDAFLDRISRRNDRTNAFIAVFDEHARKAARDAERAIATSADVGALHGVPIAVKDLIPVAGQPTTYGSAPLKTSVSDTDAIAVARLRDEGAIVIGKTNTSEFGHIATTDNELFGPTGTPFDPTKTSGGSSGGSAAAVADGLVPLALGTDAGGSVRIPASACGVYGFKPTFGRVPRNTRPNAFINTHPFTEIGPLSRTVEDSALALDIIAGPHSTDPFCAPHLGSTHRSTLTESISDLTIGYTLDFDTRLLDGAVRDVVTDTISTLSETALDIEPATPTIGSLWGEMLDAARVIFQTRMTELIETAETTCSVDLTDHLDELTPSLAAMVEQGRDYTVLDLTAANTTRTALYDSLQGFFSAYDLLITPTLAVPPFEKTQIGPSEIDGESINPYTDWYFTLPFNMTGLPAASLPAGLSENGLPIGIQLVGNRHDDTTVFNASAALEPILSWTDHYPPFRT